MKILFTHSYFLRFDPKQWKAKQPYPPLGTIYAAAVLREQGHSVSLFDTMFAKKPEEIIPRLENEKPDILVIYDDGFNYLTKMCLTNMREAAFRMIKLGRQYRCQVIVCSSDSSDHYEKYLDRGANFIVIGEGEITLRELLKKINSHDLDYRTIEGLAFQENGKTILTPKRDVWKELDSLPIPAWDLVDLATYRQVWQNHQGYFSLNLATTRGCPFKCNWCAKPIYGNRYHSRSPGNVIHEIQFLLNHYQPDHFWFCDDIFGLKPGWIEEFYRLVIEKKLKFKFRIQCRVDLLLQENTIEWLSRAGCETVWVGAESGSQKILDAMEKGITVEQIYEARRLLGQFGIKTAFFLQFGYLGETQNDIQATLKMLNEVMPDEIGVSISYPLPGTKFYDLVKSDLTQKSNWTDSDELALMFRNTYSPKYYKRLHRFVHKNYRGVLGLRSLKALLKNPLSLSGRRIRSGLSAFYFIPAAFVDQLRLKSLQSN
jgi:radical SAM superfamily enzyme YgiQ (UPF0313 family)